MTLSEIQLMPTAIDNTHESCFRSYHILDKAIDLISRGDSKQTILDIIEHLRTMPENHKEKTVLNKPEPSRQWATENQSW